MKDKKRTLFEIPIYAMSPKEFDRRWRKKKCHIYEGFLSAGNSMERARDLIRMFCYPYSTWKYNQIIGYLVISISGDDVWVDLLKAKDRRYHAIRAQKHYIEDMMLSGTHFNTERMDDTAIHTRIREMLGDIKTHSLKDKLYVDYSTFDNIFDYVDIKRIMIEAGF